nr:MAG TPA: hypothetical protein [Caudoviricetes sp.]
MGVFHTNHYKLFPSQAYARRRHRPQTTQIRTHLSIES